MKFKVGDKVKCVESPIGDVEDKYVDQIVTVSKVDGSGNIEVIKEWEEKGWSYDNQWFTLAKKITVHFILKYNLNACLVEEFETIKEASDRIKEVAQRSDVKRDSFVVYEIKSKKIAKFDTRISLKAA